MRVKTKDIDNNTVLDYRCNTNGIAKVLIDDIKANGFNGRHPLVVVSRVDAKLLHGIVTNKKYVLVSGFMRYLAAVEADCDVICKLYRPRLTLLQKFLKMYLTLLYYVV